MSNPAPPRPVRNGPGRHVKRTLEAVAVALPALFMLVGMVFLSGSLVFGTGTWLFVAGVLALASLVLTQHWIAYVLVLAAGILFLFQIELLVLGAWIFGGIYLVVSISNLLSLALRGRAARPS